MRNAIFSDTARPHLIQRSGNRPHFNLKSLSVRGTRRPPAMAGQALLDARTLPLNADCAEFCPSSGLEDLLAVGTYQLDSQTQRRDGCLHLFALRGPRDSGLASCSLADVNSEPCAGIFDIKWAPEATARSEGGALLAMAGADGSVSLWQVQRAAGSGKGEAPAASLHRAVSVEVGGPDMCVTVDWGRGPASDPAQLAVSTSGGGAAVLQVREGGMQEVVRWKGHDLECWCVAWDHWTPSVVYTGGDDAKLKTWDLRQGAQECHVNSRAHGAGVCCAQSSPHRQHQLLTGSYDQRLRVWDARMPAAPLLAEAVDTGGGVWRVKWHPSDESLVLAACMHAGFAIARVPSTEQGLEIVERYDAQGGDHLAYGVDWYQGPGDPSGRCLVTSCSFYDRLLHVWLAETRRAGFGAA